MARRASRSGSTKTASSGVKIEQSDTPRWCYSCEQVQPVRYSRIGDESAPTDVVCNVCHSILEMIWPKGATPPASS
jgi:hypothetical protein